MKKLILLLIIQIAATASLSAAFSTFTFDNGFENAGNILDGNVNPWSDTRLVSGAPETGVTGLSVRLNLSGGFNGDLYGYLSFGGAMVPLLNRLGVSAAEPFGYADSGLNVVFTDSAANNIHFYQAVPGYSLGGGTTWKPDGRMINPVTSAPSEFEVTGTAALQSLLGQNPNAEWTLVLADLASGGGQASVVSWGLDFTTAPVPEPASTGVLVALLCLVQLGLGLRKTH